MARIYVTETDTDADDYDAYEPADDPRQPQRRAGFFTEESATYWHGTKEVFDGANLADVNTRDQNRGQGLYRTAQGRWVLRTWSNWQGETDTYRYTTDTDARDWLIFNAYEDDARKHFGEIEDERGPGRPEIGAPIQIRVGELLPKLEAWAAEHNVSRAEAARRLLAQALNA